MNITMGNDEFILYIRKQYPGCTQTNDVLGRRIWTWMRVHIPEVTKVSANRPCAWGMMQSFVPAPHQLPHTATQFSFDRAHLPALYDYLDCIGQNSKH